MAGGGGGDNDGGVSVRVASSWWARMSVGARGRVEWFEGRVDVIGKDGREGGRQKDAKVN